MMALPSPQKRYVVCAVNGCKRTSLDGKMHAFRRNNAKLNAKWLKIIGRPDLADHKSLYTKRICSIHFSSKQRYPAGQRSKSHLLESAVPDQYLVASNKSNPSNDEQATSSQSSTGGQLREILLSTPSIELINIESGECSNTAASNR